MNNSEKNVWKNKGFSLVEIMIASGLAAALGLLVMNITKESNKTSTKLQSDIDATVIANEVMGYLADPQVCQNTNNLGNKSIASLPGSIANVITQVRKKDGTNVYATGTAAAGPFYGPSALSIASYTFDDPTAGNTDGVNSQIVNSRDAYLTIHFRKKQINQNTAGTAEILRKIKIVFQTNASDTGTTIQFCKATSTGYDGVWDRGTGAYINTINYANNVGISTTTPDFPLSVNGIIAKVTNDYNAGVTGSSFQISTGATTGNTYSNLQAYVTGGSATGNLVMQSVGGNVGIGMTSPNYKLDVTGNVNVTGNEYVSGNIGIGTTSPAVKLDIVNAGTAAKIRVGTGTGSGLEFINSGTSITIPATNSLALTTNTAERMRITSSGQVGVNTTTPAAGSMMDVNGRLIISYANANTDGLNTASATFDNDAATKLWVKNQIAALLGDTNPTLLNTLASTIANYATSNTMGVIRQNVCTSSQIKVQTKNFGTPAYTTITGSYSGSTCTYQTINALDCATSGNCNAIYAQVYYAENGGTGGGFCVNGKCLTRADRFRCPDGYFMYGIANGFPQCKQDNVASPATPTDTALPYTY